MKYIDGCQEEVSEQLVWGENSFQHDDEVWYGAQQFVSPSPPPPQKKKEKEKSFFPFFWENKLQALLFKKKRKRNEKH